MVKKIVYVKMVNPSGRITTRKLLVRSKTLKGIQGEYLGTSEHFRKENFPIAIVKKPKRVRVIRKNINDPFNLRILRKKL